MPGTVLRERPTAYLLREAKRGLAILHEHAASQVARAAPIGAMERDRVLYFADHKRLDELRPQFGSLFGASMGWAQEHLYMLWKQPPHPPRPPHLLHGDYTWHNILDIRDRLAISDFPDLLWGSELQDEMIAVFPFDWAKDGVELGGWFKAGYEAVRPGPIHDPDRLAALLAA